jgi:hypothetical protein
MKRTAMWATFIGIVAVIATLMCAAPYHQSRAGTEVSPFGNPPVGTAGRQATNELDESPATLHDLETVTGSVDPHELIGGRVDLHVKVADINNYTSFWVGNKDNRMLVVLGRDNRSDAQRIHGAPSPNDIKPAAPGQMVRITGTIEGIPDAEARYSWGLNDSERRALHDQKVYIRADHVTPEG